MKAKCLTKVSNRALGGCINWEVGHSRISRRRGEKHQAATQPRLGKSLLDEKYGARTLTANKLSKSWVVISSMRASFETPALVTSTTSRSSTMRRTSNASFYGPSAVAKIGCDGVCAAAVALDHRAGVARDAAIVDQHLSARFPEG
jgi:hypothetical protein